MNKTDTMTCTSCQKQKFKLRPRKSKLMPSTTLFLCNDCFDGKYEPRFAIILHGKQFGLDSVAEYIRNHRYVGESIVARELLPRR
jgi:hypothetical protein